MIPGKKLEFAAKVTHKATTPKDEPRSERENKDVKRFTFNEISILSRLRHKNVVCRLVYSCNVQFFFFFWPTEPSALKCYWCIWT